jgi:hypothetical protein
MEGDRRKCDGTNGIGQAGDKMETDRMEKLTFDTIGMKCEVR